MSKQSAPPICRQPDHIISYFSMQKGILAVITVSGLIYNLGLMVRPWFEGQMIQCLFFIQKGQSHFSDMLKLASVYFIASDLEIILCQIDHRVAWQPVLASYFNVILL